MSPRHTEPSSSPSPSASVEKRKLGPSASRQAYVTASFSFEAGINGSPRLWAYTALPVVRSTATAPVRDFATWGTESARESFLASGIGPAAAPGAEERKMAASATAMSRRGTPAFFRGASDPVKFA